MSDSTSSGVYILPIIPIGVAVGYLAVRTIPERLYRAFIYLVLAVTSITLIAKSLN